MALETRMLELVCSVDLLSSLLRELLDNKALKEALRAAAISEEKIAAIREEKIAAIKEEKIAVHVEKALVKADVLLAKNKTLDAPLTLVPVEINNLVIGSGFATPEEVADLRGGAHVKIADGACAPTLTTYVDVKKCILALSSKNRELAIELLTTFNVKKGTELAESQYGAFVVQAQTMLAL